MSTSKLDISLAEGRHKLLQSFIGRWQGHTKTWFEPGEPVDSSPMSGNIRSLLDGRFLLHEYTGAFQGQPLQGIAIYGFHFVTSSFQAAWIDSFHMGTGIMLSEGKQDGKVFDVLGAYQASAVNTEKWGWRTTIDFNEQNELVITAYNISPSGEEAKATETIYTKSIQEV